MLAPDVVAPDVDEDHVGHRQRKQRGLLLERRVVLAALPAVAPLQRTTP